MTLRQLAATQGLNDCYDSMTRSSPVIVANWKMHMTLPEAQDFLKSLHATLGKKRPTVVIAPPAVHLHPLHPHAKRCGFHLCAQNIHHEEKGAYTGETSLTMVSEYVSHVLVGHSERRIHAHEKREHTEAKLQLISRYDHRVILCVSDEDGEEALIASTTELLRAVPARSRDRLAVMFEPSWAISTFRKKRSISDQEWKRIFTTARSLQALLKKTKRANISLLYGGSITPDNTSIIFGEGIFSGGVVGNASLEVEKFAAICERVMRLHSDS